MALGVAIRVNSAPDQSAGAVESVEVIESIGQPTHYRLDYSFDIESGDFPLLTDAKFGPGSDLSVVVSSGATSECLV